MAFGRTQEINYQEEFGVTSKDELKAKLAKVKELEDANAGLTNTVSTQTTEIASIKETLASLQQNNNNNNNNNRNNNNNTNNGNNEQHVEIPSVTDNEDAAFATRLLPLHMEQIKTRAMLNEDRILRELKEQDPYFAKLEKETRELIKKTPIQMRGDESHGEEVIRNAYLVVKGKHSHEIINDTRAGKGEFFIEPARNSSSGSSTTNTVDQDPNKLSPEEESLIARMGLTKEQYLKSKQSNINMSGALRYA